MKYYQKFPQISYVTTEVIDGLPQTFTRQVPNMTVRFQADYAEGSHTWYTIQDRDRPDTLAASWYGSSNYTWVVLLSNGMRDLYDWPMSSIEFAHYMNKKYETTVGANNGIATSQAQVHEYQWTNPTTDEIFIVDEVFYNDPDYTSDCTDVKVYDYETQLNDARRNIKWLTPQSFQLFITQFDTLTGIA